jgi:hypothetical protein
LKFTCGMTLPSTRAWILLRSPAWIALSAFTASRVSTDSALMSVSGFEASSAKATGAATASRALRVQRRVREKRFMVCFVSPGKGRAGNEDAGRFVDIKAWTLLALPA